MQFPSTALLALLLSPLALSAPSSPFFDIPSQIPITTEGEIRVPGVNPLTYCVDPSANILTIERVDLSPNPPVPGKPLEIKASGIFSKQVDKGAKVQLQVKYGFLQLINQQMDLCEQTGNVGLECPLEKGKMVFSKSVDIPAEVPPGKYTVKADVMTADEEPVTCLEAAVTFEINM